MRIITEIGLFRPKLMELLPHLFMDSTSPLTQFCRPLTDFFLLVRQVGFRTLY
jgi:hypothetical protein